MESIELGILECALGSNLLFSDVVSMGTHNGGHRVAKKFFITLGDIKAARGIGKKMKKTNV